MACVPVVLIIYLVVVLLVLARRGVVVLVPREASLDSLVHRCALQSLLRHLPLID